MTRKELIKNLVEQLKQGATTKDIEPVIDDFINKIAWEEKTKEIYKDIETVGNPQQEFFYKVMEQLKQGYKENIYKDIYIILKYKRG